MSNMLLNKFKNHVIYSYIKISDPPKYVVFTIDQSMEVSKHIIFETRMVVTTSNIYPFHKFSPWL
jgi:hypothetical protein